MITGEKRATSSASEQGAQVSKLPLTGSRKA